MPDLVLLGVVTGARGLRGEVRIKSFTADPADVLAYGPVRNEKGDRVLTGRVTGQAKSTVLARFDGIDDRTAAEGLKGMRLYVARNAMPEPDEDEFYHSDLVGLRAELTNGDVLGDIRGVHDAGAGASLEIAGPDGPLMVPFTRAAVPVVDIAGGRVVIEPPAGLLEPAEPEGSGE